MLFRVMLNVRSQEDIPLLAEHFMKQITKEHGTAKLKYEKSAIKELQKINWSGNIREFRNVIERLIILCNDTITAKDVKMFAQPIRTK